MIVCTNCGFDNEDDARFCGGCQEFLEWAGERLEADDPVLDEEPEVEDEAAKGIVTRVVDRLTGQGEPPSDADPDGVGDAGSEDVATLGTVEADDDAERLRVEAAERAEREAEAAERARQEAEARLRAQADEAERAQRHAEEVAATATARADARAAEEAEAEARAAVEADARSAAEAQEAARAAAEAEEARRVAEAEAAREREAAERARRAAALVARPPATPPKPAEAPATTAPAPRTSARRRRREAEGVTPPVAVDETNGTAGDPGPVAVKPGRAKVRPHTTRSAEAPQRRLRPGDLVCGKCGEGNASARNFCSRCGHTLAEAEVVRVPWWKRAFTRKPKVHEAGARPSRGRGKRTSGKGLRAKLGAVRRIVFGPLAKATRLLGIVAFAAGAIGISINPNLRAMVMDTGGEWFDSARRVVAPRYEPVSAVDAAATSHLPEHPPIHAVDLARNTWWAAAPSDDHGVGERLEVTFAQPVDIAVIGVISGAAENFLDQPRPQQLRFVFDTGDAATIDLEEGHDFQDFSVTADGVTTVQVEVLAVFRGQEGSSLSVTEIEFKTRR